MFYGRQILIEVFIPCQRKINIIKNSELELKSGFLFFVGLIFMILFVFGQKTTDLGEKMFSLEGKIK